MTDKLRIEFDEAEKEAAYGDVAVSFSVHNGNVIISAHWGRMDELWGDGCSVTIPPRVWAVALPWIAARTRS
jgi:hypothetical protein